MFKQLLPAFPKLRNQSKNSRQRRNRRACRRLAVPETLETRRLLAVDPLGLLNDEFDTAGSVSEWSRVNQVEGWNADQLATWDVNTTQASRMVLEPHTVVWYQDWRGPLVFKEVTGDFVFTSEVHITDRDDIGDSDADDVPSDGDFSLGGLMIRTPRNITNPATDWAPGSMQNDGTNNGENYVFLSMGYGNSGAMSFEVKTTRNSNSQLELTPVNSNTATLQIARVGNSIITLLRLPGEDWRVHRRYSRPDMPATMQVGVVSYSNWEKAGDFAPFFHNSNVLVPGIAPDPTPGEAFTPDIEAGFEYARFATPQVPASLAGVDLVNNATDQQLISFLGDNANCLGGCTIGDSNNNHGGDPPVNHLKIGMNLETPYDWANAWTFTDIFQTSRDWFSHSSNTVTGDFTWSGGGEVHVDANGWPTALNEWTNEQGQVVRQWLGTAMFSEGDNPAGIYRAEWEGTGTVIWNHNAGIVDQGTMANGRHFALLNVPADLQNAVYMRITAMDSSDPIRDVNVWMPDYAGQSFAGQDWQPGDNFSPFHPLFLERLAPFDTLRFMQWMETNDSDIVSWSDRTTLDDVRQHSGDGAFHRGMAPEYMIALSNELNADPWFNMPHMADDDYVRNFATMVRDTLDPELEIYVEWSNEVWNSAGGFEAFHWVTEQMSLPANNGLDRWAVVAQETRRDFAIWSDVFAGQEDRLVRVVAGQQANVWLVGQILQNMNGEFDAVSSTAYSGLGSELVSQFNANSTPDEVIDTLLNVSVPWSLARVAEHRDLAEQYAQALGRDIQLVNYEGGSHPYAWNHPAVDVIHQASLNPRMYDVYTTLLEGLENLGVDAFVQYQFTGDGQPSPWGDYGLLHSQDQPLAEAHDYRALADFAMRNDTGPNDSLVQVRLETVNANGDSISSVTVGETFFLRASVDDLRSDGSGVFSAYLDVVFAGDLASVDGSLTFGSAYVNAREGNTATAGLIDEAGAVATGDALGGEPALLFSVPVRANAVGELIFASNAAELQPQHEVTLYNYNNPVDLSLIDFGSVTINIIDQFDVANDAFTVNEDTTNSTLDVLANDAVSASVEINAVGSTSAGGTVSIAANGRSLVYTPAANYFGGETFTYTVRNAAGETRRATVNVTVNNVNDNPVAMDNAFSINNRGQATSFNVLANDSIAPDSGETLSIASVGTPTRGGSVSVVNGEIVYTPATNFFGGETFTYTIADGHGGTAQASVFVTVTKLWHNAARPTDVTNDAHTSPLDALQIINALNGGFGGPLSATPTGAMASMGYLDTNDDGFVSPLDALMVFNALNDAAVVRNGGGGEGEGSANARVAEVVRRDVLVERTIASPLVGDAAPVNRLTGDLGLGEDDVSYQLLDLESALADIAEDVLSGWRESN